MYLPIMCRITTLGVKNERVLKIKSRKFKNIFYLRHVFTESWSSLRVETQLAEWTQLPDSYLYVSILCPEFFESRVSILIVTEENYRYPLWMPNCLLLWHSAYVSDVITSSAIFDAFLGHNNFNKSHKWHPNRKTHMLFVKYHVSLNQILIFRRICHSALFSAPLNCRPFWSCYVSCVLCVVLSWDKFICLLDNARFTLATCHSIFIFWNLCVPYRYKASRESMELGIKSC